MIYIKMKNDWTFLQLKDIYMTSKDTLFDKKSFMQLPHEAKLEINLILDNLPKNIVILSYRKNFFQNIHQNNIVDPKNIMTCDQFNRKIEDISNICTKLVDIEKILDKYKVKKMLDSKDLSIFNLAKEEVNYISTIYNNIESYSFEFSSNKKAYAAYMKISDKSGFIVGNPGSSSSENPNLVNDINSAFLFPELEMVKQIYNEQKDKCSISAIEVDIKYKGLVDFGDTIPELQKISNKIVNEDFVKSFSTSM